MPAGRKPASNGRRRGRDGSIGRETFAQVEKMMAEEKIKRAEAFRRIAAQSGRSAQSVATNYYRIARASGVPLRKRRGAKRAMGAKAGRVAGGDVSRALDAVARLLREQENELARLRAENAKYAALRKLLGK